MAIAIEDLVKDITPEEVLEDLLLLARALGLSTKAWEPGEPILALVTILAEQIAKLWNNVLVKAIRAGFLDYASGVWLTLLAWVAYGVVRREATFATGTCTVENQGGGFYTITPGDLRIANVDGKTFVNTTGGILGAWDGSSEEHPALELEWQADEAGTGSTTAIGDIVPDLRLGFAGIFAKSNTSEFIGQDEEEDDLLKDRCRAETSRTSPAGAKDAYRAVALSTKRPDGTFVNVTRVRVLEPGGGVNTIILASANDPAAGDVGSPGSDVYLVNQAIQLEVVPAGLVANVVPAVNHDMTVDVTIYVDQRSLLTTAEAEAKAKKAVSDFFRRLPIGGNRLSAGGPGFVFKGEVEAKASESAEGIFRAAVTLSGTLVIAGTDTGNVLLAENEIAQPTTIVTAVIVPQ